MNKTRDALKALYQAFQHAAGNDKGNRAKTDIIALNPDVRAALNQARQALEVEDADRDQMLFDAMRALQRILTIVDGVKAPYRLRQLKFSADIARDLLPKYKALNKD